MEEHRRLLERGQIAYGATLGQAEADTPLPILGRESRDGSR